MLQTGTILCYDKMVKEFGVEPAYAVKLLQYGWETISEALKHGGITNMMDRLSNPAKIRATELAEKMKKIMKPLYQEHQDNIISGKFSSTMMVDWEAGDKEATRTSSSGVAKRANSNSKRSKLPTRSSPNRNTSTAAFS